MNPPVLTGTQIAKSSSSLWTPFNPVCREDPYPMYRRIRAEDPVHRTGSGDWVVSRYADACTVFTDKRFDVIDMPGYFREKALSRETGAQSLEDTYRATFHWLLYLRRPLHGRVREMVMKIWASLNLDGCVQRVLDELADELESLPAVDLLNDLAKPLPVRIIARLLGFPDDSVERLKYWGEQLANVFEPMLSRGNMEEINRAAGDFMAFVEDCIREQQRAPGDNLTARLLQQRDAQGNPVDSDELVSLIINLFVAGEETTRNLVGNGFAALSAHPEQFELLRNRPELLKTAVEEMLRYDSPVQITSRMALEDVELGGRLIRAGEQLYVCIGSANHDEQQFENPEGFDITRQKNKHLAFGFGSHFCLGAMLARMQAMGAFRMLMARFPALRADLSRAVHRRNLLLRGYSALPTYRI
ncbi:cytochrome P450 [Larkinella soli]|uniref:cytochrome P450 n=1 Tax=Larkinella soli TaxID=1770527 RepID=UPI0013E3A924|nr:cytochrome P450 [Larkinella soli]